MASQLHGQNNINTRGHEAALVLGAPEAGGFIGNKVDGPLTIVSSHIHNFRRDASQFSDNSAIIMVKSVGRLME